MFILPFSVAPLYTYVVNTFLIMSSYFFGRLLYMFFFLSPY